VIFILKYVFRIVFEGGILGGARNFWGNPYLNSTTVLFDENKKRNIKNAIKSIHPDPYKTLNKHNLKMPQKINKGHRLSQN